MPQRRAPWWMYLLAASFFAYFTVVDYTLCFGPEQVGMTVDYRHDGAFLAGIVPDSPADRAGLRPGDHVIAANGLPVHHQFDWGVVGANFEVDHLQRIEIERAGAKSERQVILRPRIQSWGHLAPDVRAVWVWYLCLQIVMLGLCLLIAFSRPYDLAARLGSALLVSTPAALLWGPGPGSPYGLAAIWRHLPGPVGAVMWIPHLVGLSLAVLLLSFCSIFPRRILQARWIWAAWGLFAVLVLPLASHFFYAVYEPGKTVGLLPDWYPILAWALGITYVFAALAALVTNYQRLTDRNERRRLRVLVLGTAIGWLGLVPPSAASFLEGKIGDYLSSLPSLLLSLLLFLAFPLSFAYAILRHRVFDLGVIIRQGLQYALARAVLVWMLPAAVALFFLDVAMHQGDVGLIAIGNFFAHSPRGWFYAVIGALVLVAQHNRKAWLDSLDRRFFRERYDAQRLLREVVEVVRGASSLQHVAPSVVAHAEAALHPEFAALLVREPREPAYRILASSPAGQAPPPLSAESKLVSLVRLLGKPLEVPHTESGWLQQQLPHEETDFLRRARIELFVPVAKGTEHTEALLVLGTKRSEEPYSREDIDLLVAIASSLALLLERPAAPAPRLSNAFEECPQCGACYDSGTVRCTQEGTVLTPTPLPRLLSDRYFLERRLGRGGMGTVYQAMDKALERRVAAKVIRDDFVGSAEAAERFRREARAAASFTHPNVVTVFDYGVALEVRAFLVMELLEGASLRETLRRQGRLPAPRALPILRGVISAVDAAHRRQLIHRDLKPENIYLVPQDSGELAKVLDFGVAKFLPTDTQATQDAETGGGVLLGTLRYMSPEQLRGEPADTAWDLWALAAVAYEMLTGKHPFERGQPGELSRAILYGRFTPVAAHLPDAPGRWQEFFTRAFALDPSRRPQSAGLFLAELESAIA